MRWLAVLAVCGLGVTAHACGGFERCDRNQKLVNYICLPAGPVADASAPVKDAHVDEPMPLDCSQKGAGFRATCTRDDECPCGLDLCAKFPGQTTGRCTKKACETMPDVCPADAPCTDVSAFSPDVPRGFSICMVLGS